VLYGLGQHRIMARWRAVEAAANILISLALVKPLALVGVALGTTIAHVAMTAIALPFAISRVLNIPLREYYVSTYGRPFLAAVPYALACYYINTFVQPASLLSFFALVAGALVIYVVPCWFVALSAADRRFALARASVVLPSRYMGGRLARVLGAGSSAGS
jgi:O-antigen/teichoic acid export membrane protein